MANLNPADVRRVNVGLSEFLQDELDAERARDARRPAVLRVRNTAAPVLAPGDPTAGGSPPSNFWRWRLSVAGVPPARPLAKVVYHLHPTFTPSTVEVFPTVGPENPEEPGNDFALSRTGWGTFPVRVDLHFKDPATEVLTLTHELTFDGAGAETCCLLPAAAGAVAPPTAPAATQRPGPAERRWREALAFGKDGGPHLQMSLVANLAARAYGEVFGVGPGSKSDLKRLHDPERWERRNPPSKRPEQYVAPRCMENVSEAAMHGRVGVGEGWLPPRIAHECAQQARPGYDSALAHEYQEAPSTLRAKVAALAELLRAARHCVAYTGAGISTASGIDDYASKGRQSLATGAEGAGAFRPKGSTGLDAEPTFAHYTLAALQQQGMVHSWVQQNHDGLPQKAGFPQHLINEIHGAWFDPSNPVVPMDGSLRDDLYARMLEDEQKADLVLTIGTSLCGMNADRVVRTAAAKYCESGQGLGSVIIGFQRTPLDDTCSLRIFARIDEVMLLLAREMGLRMDLTPYRFVAGGTAGGVLMEPWVYRVPYDRDGAKASSSSILDLRVGAKIKLTGGPGKGYVGQVMQVPVGTRGSSAAASFCVRFPCTRENDPAQGKTPCLYALGGWMVEAAMNGELGELPVVNV